jgi:mono/diheme cytochrome c family protein
MQRLAAVSPAVSVVVGLMIGAPAAAQSIDAGRQYAQRVCAQCHAIERPAAPPRGMPPSLSAIASLPSTTELSLRAFLQTPHAKMPNLILSPGDTANVVAFILSLRKP